MKITKTQLINLGFKLREDGKYEYYLSEDDFKLCASLERGQLLLFQDYFEENNEELLSNASFFIIENIKELIYCVATISECRARNRMIRLIERDSFE